MKVRAAGIVLIITLSGCTTATPDSMPGVTESPHTTEADSATTDFSILTLSCSDENGVSITAVMNADTESVVINRASYSFVPPTGRDMGTREMHFSHHTDGNITDLYFDMSRQGYIPLRMVSHRSEKLFTCRSGKG